MQHVVKIQAAGRCAQGNEARLRSVLGRILLVMILATLGVPRFVRADAAEDFSAALSRYKAKRFDVAADGFAAFLKAYPDHARKPLAELYLGQSLMQLKKFNEARETFATFLKSNADHADRPLALYRLAECSYFLNDLAGAQSTFEQFLDKYPGNDLAVWAWHYLGESRRQLKDPAKAVEAYQQVIEKFSASPLVTESKFGLARAYEALGDDPKAIAVYSELSADEKNPRAADATLGLGAVFFDSRQFAHAARTYAAFRERFPQHALVSTADLNAGSSYFHLKQYDDAIAAFERAAASPKDEVQARDWIGISLKVQNKFDDAAAALKAAYEKLGDQSGADRLLFHWADSEFRGGHSAEAVPLFLQFVQKFPTSDDADDALHYAVEAALLAGDVDQAEKLHQRFQKEYFAGSGLKQLENLLYGRVLLAKAEKLSPQSPLSPEATSLIRAAADQFSAVLKGTEIERTRDWARLLLGRAQYRLGDNKAVLETLQPLNERLVQKAAPAEFSEALFLTGRSAADTSNFAAAETAFENYLTLSPTAEDAAKALTQLAVIKVEAGKEEELEALWPRLEGTGVPVKSQAEAVHAAAELSFKKGEWADAARLFTRLSTLKDATGFQAIALSGLGHCEFQSNRFPEAEAAFAKLLQDIAGENARLTVDATYMQGLSLERAGQKKEAADAYRAGALKLAGVDGKITMPPSDPETAWFAFRCCTGAARTQAELGDAEAADASFADAWRIQPGLSEDRRSNLPLLVYDWALTNYKGNRFARSDELFQLLRDQFPTSEYADDAAHFLAESQLQEGDFDKAEAAFQSLLDNPQSDEIVRSQARATLMELAARKNDWKKTGEHAAKILQQPDAPKRLQAEYRLGESQLRQDQAEAAAATLGKLRDTLVAATDPQASSFEWSEGVWLLLAEADLQTKNYPAVDQLIAEFRTRFPSSRVAYQADEIQGRRFMRTADFDKAREAFQRTIDSPDGAKTETAARAQTAIADCFLQQSDYASAVVAYYKVVDVYDFPELKAVALYQAAVCQEKQDKLTGAVQTYEELVEKYPDSEPAARARGRLVELKATTE